MDAVRRKATALTPRFHVMLVSRGCCAAGARAVYGSYGQLLLGYSAPRGQTNQNPGLITKQQNLGSVTNKTAVCYPLQTTYDVCLRDTAVLRRFDWSGLVIDEGHSLKGEQHKGFPLKERNRKLAAGLGGCAVPPSSLCAPLPVGSSPELTIRCCPLHCSPPLCRPGQPAGPEAAGAGGALAPAAHRHAAAGGERAGSTSACTCGQMIAPSVPSFDMLFRN